MWALVVCAVLGFSVLNAQTVTLLDFGSGFAGSATELNYQGSVNGSAMISGSVARITTKTFGGHAGTVWSKTPVEIRNFETEFSIQMDGVSSSNFADGMAFVIQAVGNTEVGSAGGSLGYEGINNSICVKFDTFHGAGATYSSTGLYENGEAPDDDAPDSINLTSSGVNFRTERVFDVTLTYDGTTLEQEIVDTVTNDTFTQSYIINIPLTIGANSAYVGFTGATAGQKSTQDVQNWTYSVVPVPYDVSFTEFPKDLAIIPRDLTNDLGTVTFTGTESMGGLSEIILRKYRDDVQDGPDVTQSLVYVDGSADFSVSIDIPAERALYDVDVLISDGIGGEFFVARANDLVAGDIIIVQGQSNAESRLFSGSSSAYIDPYVRTFGLNTESSSGTESAVSWAQAIGDGSHEVVNGIGQWPLVMANTLSMTHDMPIGLINGADPGRPISFFQRNDADPDDTATNYGRLLFRMQAAGIADDVRAFLYYQGEQESGDDATHEAGYLDLKSDWAEDYPSVEQYYVNQVREGCGVARFDVDLRNVQRQFGDRFADVNLMSPNALDGHDGCHYSFTNGYEVLGLFYEGLLSRDLYGVIANDVEPPNAAWAELVTGGPTDIVRVHFRNTDDTYSVVGSDAEDDFEIQGLPGGVTIDSVTIAPGGDAFDLVLSGSGTGVTEVSYTGEQGAGDWIVNASGVGLLSFIEPIGVDSVAPVITLSGANPQNIEWGDNYTELGATASDAIDGDITGVIVTNSSAVNVGALGSYLVTYNASDFSGNAATQLTRTVNVVDTIAPEIALVGANPQVIECGSSYSELGATANDSCDGDLTGSIAIDTMAVNTSAVGSYVVTYNVDDASGNSAVEVTRTVNVVDTTPPVITLTGINPQVIECGDAYSELGATANDVCDGDLTGSIVVDSSSVNTSVVGSYVVTYNVMDLSTNAATEVTRTIDVVDTTPPALTLLGANPQVIECGSSYTELNATALDACEGDVTGAISINSSAVNTTVLGSYLVTYDVSDSVPNAATQVTRTVNVVDTTGPVITLNGANPQVVECGDSYSELGASALDACEGSVGVTINSTAVNTAVIGNYNVTYDAVDSVPNAASQVVRTVQVVDTTPPVIILTGANPQVIECGDAYSELGATASDICDGNLTGSIVINDSAVDISMTGSYEVTYNVTDLSNNAAVEVTRTVNVVDTTPPVITLNGANPQVIECGDSYSELGATAIDACEGNLTMALSINSSTVNTAVIGSYTVTYDVSDSVPNAAVQVTRTVQVVDSTGPVITLTGANPQIIECGDAYSELGATALDACEGSVSVTIDASAVNTSATGSYTVTYDAVDSVPNAAVQVTRTVQVVDTTAPVISVPDPGPLIHEGGSAFVDPGATATDACDGIVPLTSSTNVDGMMPGSYFLTYDYTDMAGNAASQVVVAVDVVDTTPPVLTLLGDNPQILYVGDAYSDPGATAMDVVDGDISGSIAVGGDTVTTTGQAIFNVTYDVSDLAGNMSNDGRTVRVVAQAAPEFEVRAAGVGLQDVEIEFPTVLGLDYTVYRNSDLEESGWIQVGSVVIGDDQTVIVTDVGGVSSDARFYRVGVTKTFP